MEDSSNPTVARGVDTETVSAAPADPTATDTTSSATQSWRQRYGRWGALVGLLVLVGGVIWLAVVDDSATAPQQFTNVYSFVPEKVSQSAPIRVKLPAGVHASTAAQYITFDPEIDGTWQAGAEPQQLQFTPEKPLQLGTYYAVTLDTDSVQLSGDVYVEEDPEITAIFPHADTETPEHTEITIVFNRPMVPLTTLSGSEAVDVPVRISPETAGSFKWISSRTLQFVPETTLRPASDYEVEVQSGFTSLDGLAVAPTTHRFSTRALRYEHVSDGTIGYRAPIVLDYNQPVDLEVMRGEITVRTDEGDRVPVTISYGERSYYDREAREQVTEEDQSKLFIKQTRDRHGRRELWDFTTTYEVTVDEAVPLYGTQRLTEEKVTVVETPEVIETVQAESDRSSLVRPDLFDPQGTLAVTFYDEVSITDSSFTAPGLQDVQYAERCQVDEAGNTVRVGNECVKEDDKRTLVFSFAADAFSPGEQFTLDFASVVTPDDFTINVEPVEVPVTVYPEFQLLSTAPNTGASAGAVDGMYVCTNTPLQDPGEDGVGAYVAANEYFVAGRWSNSIYVDERRSHHRCASGTFQTHLRYGLLPETDYQLTLNLTDAFDQTNRTERSFTTATPDERYTRIHNLQQQYNVTTPDRTTFTYAVENLESLNLHLCRLSPESFLERTVARPGLYDPPQSSGCDEVITDTIQLPARYWVNNYFQIELSDYVDNTAGHYVLTMSNPLYQNSRGQQRYDRTYISATNLAVGKKEVELATDAWSPSDHPEKTQVQDEVLGRANNLYWINQAKTLAPVSGAQVTQYTNTENDVVTRADTGVSDASGLARTQIPEEVVGAVIHTNTDAAVVTDWADTLQQTARVRDASRTYIYTDRPIYRPGHTVHIRGIDRIGFDGSYEVWNEDDAPLTIYDAQGTEIYETNVPISQYGTFTTDFALPSDAPLGTYRVEVLGHSGQFTVEEYEPAAFQVETELSEEEYVNGDTLSLGVQADYYYGVPLQEGTVSYTVTAQDYHFDRYTDEYFNFGTGWYFCYTCGYGDDFWFRGETTLDETGHAVIERSLDLDDYYDDPASEGSKLVTISVTAKDVNGRSVSAQQTAVVHRGEFYLGSKTDRWVNRANEPIPLRAKTVDTSGEPLSVRDITQTVYKVEWDTFKRQEVDGGYYYRSEKRLEEVSQQTIRTDESGDWQGDVTVAESGQYEVQFTATDARDNEVRSTTRLYVRGAGSVTVPPNNNYELDMEVTSADVSTGDTASVLLKSPYDRAKALITAERGTVYDHWIVDVNDGIYLHEFPIKEEYAPNIFLSAMLLSPDPEVKYNYVPFQVDKAQHELEVTVTPNKQQYLPGESVTLQVETKDHTGTPTAAEVSIAVADLSVLALKGNPKKDPATFFYDGFPLTVSTASNIKNILYEQDIPLGTKGGGGANPEDLATKQRGEFKDTAHWSGQVETDGNGQAEVTFTLPDNLTTWQIESLGVTADTKLGVAYDEIMARKELMAVPLKPRFVVPGDRFSVGAQVNNQTDEATRVQVAVSSDSLEFPADTTDSVRIGAGESKTVYFPAIAPAEQRAGVHEFTFRADADALVDEVVQSIAITPNDTYETAATAHVTSADQVREYVYVPETVVADKGGLTVKANATLAVFLDDAMSFMARYPYGNSEQLAHTLSAVGALTRSTGVPNTDQEVTVTRPDGKEYPVDEVVADGLERIYQAQTSAGGFAYYPDGQANPTLTLSILEALVELDAAGFAVRPQVIQLAAAYVDSPRWLPSRWSQTKRREHAIQAEYLLRTKLDREETRWTSFVYATLQDTEYLYETIDSISLAHLALVAAEAFSAADQRRVYESLTNRIAIDGRGAFLRPGPQEYAGISATSLQGTALLLQVFAAYDEEHPAMANVIRWLMASRDDAGAWGNTTNTYVVVQSMLTYIEWQDEATAEFTLRGLLDAVEIFNITFAAETVWETVQAFVPMQDLEKETMLPLDIVREQTDDTASNFYYDMALQYYLPVENLPPRDEGLTITRELTTLEDGAPVTEAAVGELVRGTLRVTVPDRQSQVTIEDMIPAGFELVNFSLDTEVALETLSERAATEKADSWWQQTRTWLGDSQLAQVTRPPYLTGSAQAPDRTLHPTHTETHDDRLFLYVDELQPGVYEYEYVLRALVPGTFQHLPARVEALYFPEIFGRTAGGTVTVTPE